MIRLGIGDRRTDPRYAKLFTPVQPDGDDVPDCRHVFQEDPKIQDVVVSDAIPIQGPRLRKANGLCDIFDIVSDAKAGQLGHLAMLQRKMPAGLLETKQHLHQHAGDERAAHQRGENEKVAPHDAARPAGIPGCRLTARVRHDAKPSPPARHSCPDSDFRKHSWHMLMRPSESGTLESDSTAFESDSSVISLAGMIVTR